ncbi:hypothetical protein LCGC14_2703510, partial [marine sediment metagenome]
MEKICAYQSEEETKQDIANTLQEALSRKIGLDSPTDEMLHDHAFVVDIEDGLDYM